MVTRLNNRKINIFYSILQISYWITSAAVFCFTTVFLQSRGYSNYAIGIVFAVGNICGFTAQTLVSGYIDRNNKKPLLRCIRITALSAILLMIFVCLLPSGSLPVIFAYALIIAGNTLLNPLCISLSLYIENWGYNISFSHSRALGSFAYAICSVVLGILVQRVSENAIPTSLIIFSVLIYISASLFRQEDKLYNERRSTSKNLKSGSENAGNIIAFFKENKRFLLFLIGTAALYFTHGMIGNFMIEFIRNIGGTSEDMGNVLAFMTVVEVPVMLFFSRLTKHFKCSSLLRFAVIMFTVKEFLIYLSQSLPALYAAEALQALSFAIFVPASVKYVGEVIPKRDAVRGQSLVTSMMTLGSIFASYFGGLLLDIASPHFTLFIGVIVSAIGTIVMLGAIQTTSE